MPNCPSCGAEVGGGANFCANCGAAIAGQAGAGVRSEAIGLMIEDARRALNTNPNDLSARYNLALGYKLAGLEPLALQEFERVAAAQPDFADVHFELAQLYVKAGRKEDALAAVRRVLDLEPEHRGAKRLVGEVEGRYKRPAT